ncbi:hypothetical protein [Candidatus Kuenenia stuttgartiensis]|uniref:hypothetical protein n=1 Tax=Kuenenia stuttgartiensis TaxID=174633 RepID=UPI00146D4474|nr:hypothetical protein [Candidatus Kuenenia stuttgartiensis]
MYTGKKLDVQYSSFMQSPLTIVSILFAIGSCFFVRHIKFDDNLLNLLPPNLESTRYAIKIIQSTGTATWFGRLSQILLKKRRGCPNSSCGSKAWER